MGGRDKRWTTTVTAPLNDDDEEDNYGLPPRPPSPSILKKASVNSEFYKKPCHSIPIDPDVIKNKKKKKKDEEGEPQPSTSSGSANNESVVKPTPIFDALAGQPENANESDSDDCCIVDPDPPSLLRVKKEEPIIDVDDNDGDRDFAPSENDHLEIAQRRIHNVLDAVDDNDNTNHNESHEVGSSPGPEPMSNPVAGSNEEGQDLPSDNSSQTCRSKDTSTPVPGGSTSSGANSTSTRASDEPSAVGTTNTTASGDPAPSTSTSDGNAAASVDDDDDGEVQFTGTFRPAKGKGVTVQQYKKKRAIKVVRIDDIEEEESRNNASTSTAPDKQTDILVPGSGAERDQQETTATAASNSTGSTRPPKGPPAAPPPPQIGPLESLADEREDARRRIQAIEAKVKTICDTVNSSELQFDSNEDREYLQINETLIQYQLDLDGVESCGSSDVRRYRKSVTLQIELCIEKLKSKVKSASASSLSSALAALVQGSTGTGSQGIPAPIFILHMPRNGESGSLPFLPYFTTPLVQGSTPQKTPPINTTFTQSGTNHDDPIPPADFSEGSPPAHTSRHRKSNERSRSRSKSRSKRRHRSPSHSHRHKRRQRSRSRGRSTKRHKHAEETTTSSSHSRSRSRSRSPQKRKSHSKPRDRSRSLSPRYEPWGRSVHDLIQFLLECPKCPNQFFLSRDKCQLHIKKEHSMQRCPVCFSLLSTKGHVYKEHVLKHRTKDKNGKIDNKELVPCCFCKAGKSVTGIFQHICRKHLLPVEKRKTTGKKKTSEDTADKQNTSSGNRTGSGDGNRSVNKQTPPSKPSSTTHPHFTRSHTVTTTSSPPTRTTSTVTTSNSTEPFVLLNRGSTSVGGDASRITSATSTTRPGIRVGGTSSTQGQGDPMSSSRISQPQVSPRRNIPTPNFRISRNERLVNDVIEANKATSTTRSPVVTLATNNIGSTVPLGSILVRNDHRGPGQKSPINNELINSVVNRATTQLSQNSFSSASTLSTPSPQSVISRKPANPQPRYTDPRPLHQNPLTHSSTFANRSEASTARGNVTAGHQTSRASGSDGTSSATSKLTPGEMAYLQICYKQDPTLAGLKARARPRSMNEDLVGKWWDKQYRKTCQENQTKEKSKLRIRAPPNK